MADPSVIAAAMVTVIAATAGAIVTVVNAIAAARDRREGRKAREALAITTSATDEKADAIIQQTGEIHKVTNGNLSKVQAELAVAHEKILGLEKLVASIAAAQASAERLRRVHDVEVATALATDPATVHVHRRDTDPDPVSPKEL